MLQKQINIKIATQQNLYFDLLTEDDIMLTDAHPISVFLFKNRFPFWLV